MAFQLASEDETLDDARKLLKSLGSRPADKKPEAPRKDPRGIVDPPADYVSQPPPVARKVSQGFPGPEKSKPEKASSDAGDARDYTKKLLESMEKIRIDASSKNPLVPPK